MDLRMCSYQYYRSLKWREFRREVLNIRIRRDCLEETKSGAGCCGDDSDFSIDIEKMKPVARLGYGQEYTVILDLVGRNGE